MKRSPEELEKLIHQTLRSLPDRRAPRSLEARVLASIEAQSAALPWWKQSFAHWPIVARGLFVIISLALVRLAMVGTAELEPERATQALSTQVGWLTNLKHVLQVAGDYLMLLGQSIPPVWLYVGLAGLAATYAVLFGLGATAYRTLIAER